MSSTDFTPDATRATTLHGSAGRNLLAWLLLMGATALTWQLGESRSGALAAGLLALLALLKGNLVIHEFMALRHAPLTWRLLVHGWLLLVCALLALAYWKGLTS